MKLFVSTVQTQGQRANDYSFTEEGELVFLAEPCGRDQEDPDDGSGCGCGRAFIGAHTRRATTTAVVEDVPITTGRMIQAGWEPDDVSALVALVEPFPVGTVVERRLDSVTAR